MKARILLSMLTLLTLAACSDTGLFLAQPEEPASVQVSTIQPGIPLRAGDEVPVTITRDPIFTGDPETTDAVTVELLDHEGTVLAEQRFDSVDQAVTLPPIELPELPEGLYTLRTRYFDGDVVVTEDAVPFFLTEEEYRILGLTSYPASSSPGAEALLRVSLDVPPDADPFLVWHVNGEPALSGPLSESGPTVTITAPAGEGVFPVRVDLYPMLPDGVDLATVAAPASYSGELVVSDNPTLARTDLQPAASYFALYHFRGTRDDAGARAGWLPRRDFTAGAIGSPELVAPTDLFGYRLDGESALVTEGVVWPIHDGSLSPVSISFRVLAEALPERSRLLTLAPEGAELLALFLDDRGRLGLRVGESDAEAWSDLPMLEVGAAETVTVSIVPDGEATRVRFFADGRFISGAELDALPPLQGRRMVEATERWSMLEGTTTLGDESAGFVGVIDEFGVFFRDERNEPTTNTVLYLESMRARYGDRLVYAASFEDDRATGDLESEEEPQVGDGELRLAERSRVLFPPFRFEDEELVMSLELVVRGSGTIDLLESGNGDPLLTIDLTGPADVDVPRVVELLVVHEDGVLRIVERVVDAVAGDEPAADEESGADEPDELVLEVDDFEGVRVALGTEAQSTLRLQSILAYRDRPRVPSALFSPADE